MQDFFNSPFSIGSLCLPYRLIQGPLAGFSSAPFRELFTNFLPPAYAVSEMISAKDILHKHKPHSRYLYRSLKEKALCYQIAGFEAPIMAAAAQKLEQLGADLIDINCGCPKLKIRKKKAGSALLDNQVQLLTIVKSVRAAIKIPLTVKIRIQGGENDGVLAKAIQEAGADALIVHGRRWTEDYDKPCDYLQLATIKQAVEIPVIANGDIADASSLKQALALSHCDAFMIARAGTGKPWLYQQLLQGLITPIELHDLKNLFMTHVHALACLESDYKALLQSKGLIAYYFKGLLSLEKLQLFYQLECLQDLEQALKNF